jgi:hypothetical protein
VPARAFNRRHIDDGHGAILDGEIHRGELMGIRAARRKRKVFPHLNPSRVTESTENKRGH